MNGEICYEFRLFFWLNHEGTHLNIIALLELSGLLYAWLIWNNNAFNTQLANVLNIMNTICRV